MNNLTRKLHNLEQQVIDDNITDESLKVYLCEAPEAEQRLHEYAQQIVQRYQSTLDSSESPKYTDQENQILDKSCYLLTLRVLKLFSNTFSMFYFGEAGAGKLEFQFRLMWFMQQMGKRSQQYSQVAKLEKENAALDEDTLDRKLMELESTFEDVFTEKSFDEYEINAFRSLIILKEKK